MRLFTSILFSLLMLLSGGFVQAAVHICKDGCTMEQCETDHTSLPEQVPDCCKKTQPADKDCCEDVYVIAITPKFGTIEKFKVSNPQGFFCLGISQLVIAPVQNITALGKQRVNDRGRIPDIDFHPVNCTWLI